jgi:hypothetical protein
MVAFREAEVPPPLRKTHLSHQSFLLAAESLPGNPYDRHTLQACMEQATRVTGVTPQEAYADRGYKGATRIRSRCGCQAPSVA